MSTLSAHEYVADHSEYTDTMLTDDELVEGFEAASLSSFPHAEHVRLTIVYLSRHGREETVRRLFEGLRRFAAAKGVPEKFHVTMTRAWIELVEDARRRHPEARDPASLVMACPELLNRDALLQFYSPERLKTAEAREGWVPPDRASPIEFTKQSNTAAGAPDEIDRI
jgi:hypothetical protein